MLQCFWREKQNKLVQTGFSHFASLSLSLSLSSLSVSLSRLLEHGQRKPGTMAAASGLERYLLAAKDVRGAAGPGFIEQVTSAPDVYVFQEVLDLPQFQALRESEHASHLQLLEIFAYGTLADYTAAQAKLPAINEAQRRKLQLLSIVTLCSAQKAPSYGVLMEAADVHEVRKLEDLLIAAIEIGLLEAKLDQAQSQVSFDFHRHQSLVRVMLTLRLCQMPFITLRFMCAAPSQAIANARAELETRMKEGDRIKAERQDADRALAESVRSH
ncbi:uncharacterized protein MONBRDRAFT_26732 [Monosiga brevicollis MX1]|uniref:PCI domain-containing protein n=1 Tax=Monosiga brevicollis TaxID=81824 RepID=A9V375_MONBE|nr:uncharacterized protein MONBRDRAFT_26732 [Monosiga brevicollis MX1]EDQ88011.1 predicted protein [Monosiga brevicollis MX1]|eukprot:XP_001747087.1 hypothetical protein [Monosiga brevicollis MX1]